MPLLSSSRQSIMQNITGIIKFFYNLKLRLSELKIRFWCSANANDMWNRVALLFTRKDSQWTTIYSLWKNVLFSLFCQHEAPCTAGHRIHCRSPLASTSRMWCRLNGYQSLFSDCLNSLRFTWLSALKKFKVYFAIDNSAEQVHDSTFITCHSASRRSRNAWSRLHVYYEPGIPSSRLPRFQKRVSLVSGTQVNMEITNRLC